MKRIEMLREYKEQIYAKSKVSFFMTRGENWGAGFVSALYCISSFAIEADPEKRSYLYLLPCPTEEVMLFRNASKETTAQEVVEALESIEHHPEFRKLVSEGKVYLPDEVLKTLKEVLKG